MTITAKLASTLLLTAAAFISTATLLAQETEAGFKSLFNGKDLTGWAGRTNHWSVEEGAITGQTTAENPAKGNNFLIAKNGEENMVVSDFETRSSYKFTGDRGNAGLQYRSKDRGDSV